VKTSTRPSLPNVTDHPLAAMLLAAAHGDHPAPDGFVEVMPSPGGPVDAIVDFTAHLVVAADVPADDVLEQLPVGDLSAWTHPSFQLWLAERLGSRPGSRDLVLAAPPADHADLELVERDDLEEHDRVQRAARYRTGLRVFTDSDEHGVLVIGRGLAGRWECAFEVERAGRNRGLGRRLALAARTFAPEEAAIFAQVAPGNVASVRALLSAGFRPIGGEVLFARQQ
jgi:RimJ/RimL family protein N-acetyltransferase